MGFNIYDIDTDIYISLIKTCFSHTRLLTKTKKRFQPEGQTAECGQESHQPLGEAAQSPIGAQCS